MSAPGDFANNRVYFSPYAKPPAPGPSYGRTSKPPIQDWDEVNKSYTKAGEEIESLSNANPALAAFLGQGGGAKETDSFAKADPATARRQLYAALKALRWHIIQTRMHLITGALDPLDLIPIHAQLYGGDKAASGTNWSEALPRWMGQHLAKDHQVDEALSVLALDTVAELGFLLAPLSGGASMYLTLAGFGATAIKTGMAEDHYAILAEAAKTKLTSSTRLTSELDVDIKDSDRKAAEIELALAALGVAAETFGTLGADEAGAALIDEPTGDGSAAGGKPGGDTANDATAAAPGRPKGSDYTGPDYDWKETTRDVPTIQKLALESLSRGGLNRPVKVVPKSYAPKSALKGDFTQAKFVVGRTPKQLADELGVKAFNEGVTVYELDVGQMKPEMLNLRGYTQSPAGMAPSRSTPENLLKWPPGTGAPQWNLGVEVPALRSTTVDPGGVIEL